MKIQDAKVFVCSPGRNFVTLKIWTDEGVYGLGDATLNGRELAVASYLTDHVIPCLIGRDPFQTEDLWQYLYRGAYWRKGPVTMSAISAVDVALWDIKAKALKTPLYNLLGGKSRTGVMVYGHANGHDISQIASVASFFVSRVDTEVDKRLEKIGTPEAAALKGKAAIANARLAYELYEQKLATPRWAALAAKGARVQRPLWASTSTKDPAFPDTLYVVELVAKDTVNTMPEATLRATADHGVLRGDTIHGTYEQSRQVFAELEKLGISYDDVVRVLEDEGVSKFAVSWNELLETIRTELSTK